MTAKEFRETWLRMNPNTVHVPSEHELGLMEAYAEYYHEAKAKKTNKTEAKPVCDEQAVIKGIKELMTAYQIYGNNRGNGRNGD